MNNYKYLYNKYKHKYMCYKGGAENNNKFETLNITYLSDIFRKLINNSKDIHFYNTSATILNNTIFYIVRASKYDFLPNTNNFCANKILNIKNEENLNKIHWAGCKNNSKDLQYIFKKDINDKITIPLTDIYAKSLLNKIQSDTRIIVAENINNKTKSLFLYTRNLKTVGILNYNNQILYGSIIKNLDGQNNAVCINVQINETTINFIYLLGFVHGKFIIYIYTNDNKMNKFKVIPVSNIFHYNGTLLFPAISLGVTPIELSNNLYLGVGHIKINNFSINEHSYNLEYINDKVINIRKKIHSYMQNKYKTNYIIHARTGLDCADKISFCVGSIYMLYFYLLDINKGIIKISDAYAFKGNKKYKFSVIFPMGMYIINKDLYITCGEGDYYAVEMKFNVDDIIKKCIYDCNNFDINKYNFHLFNSSDLVF